MPTLQDLESRQIDDAVRAAVDRAVPIAVTIRSGERWVNLHSRFIAIRNERILIEMPYGDDEAGAPGPHEFVPAERVGLNFKLKHHKHICTVTAGGVEQFHLEDDTTIPVLSVCWPTRMQRLQRRAYIRADVPPGRIVRASFWLGGYEAEPAGTSPANPVWSGTVANLSAGGLQLAAAPDAVDCLEIGDIVGMRILFGLGEDTVYTDAQFRHLEKPEGPSTGLRLGFQFLGLGQTRERQRALKLLSAKVAEFQHAARRRDAVAARQ